MLKILAGSFLGARQVPIVYETQGETRIIKIEKIIDGAITPVRGKDKGNVVIRNSEYWISPDIIVSRADKSRFRLLGRNWNFEGRRRKSASSTGAIRRSGDASAFAHENAKTAAMRALAFSVHVLTACGAALALLALLAATRGDWPLMFLWLGVALVVDAIDGPLARARECRRGAAALVGRHARSGGGLHHLRVRAGLCRGRRRA